MGLNLSNVTKPSASLSLPSQIEQTHSPSSPTKRSIDFKRNLIERLGAPRQTVTPHIDPWRFCYDMTANEVRSPETLSRYVRFVAEHLDDLADLADLLADQESVDILLDVVTFRSLGPDHWKLPLDVPEFWQTRDQMDQQLRIGDSKFESILGRLGVYGLSVNGQDIHLAANPLAILAAFVQEQYALQREGFSYRARPDDVVIDAGGCWGDTALYFANLVGSRGHVYVFEFDPENLAVLSENLQANEALTQRISVVENAVWSTSGETLRYSPGGPGTSLTRPSGAEPTASTTTLSIDDFANNTRLDRLDYIKMDIEGAEMGALRGAETSIKRFRPLMGLSVYHQLDDLLEIPKLIQSWKLGYRFYMDHFTNHNEETVLFAVPQER